jgi:GT2 family glycosyltransferase
MPRVRIQLVVYRNEFAPFRRTVTAVRACVRHAVSTGRIDSATVAIGDCSPTRSLEPEQLAELSSELEGVAPLTYSFFDANLGSAGGSNRLASHGDDPLIWVLNPDTYPSPTCLSVLVDALAPGEVGACDGRQLPIEHPKGYDLATGEAHWLTGACMLIRREAFESVEGFDGHHFPMYCDDVDFSWRLRHAGWTLRTAPRAAVFHDKRPGPEGLPSGSEFELESGALARLKLARRYCRPALEQAELAAFESAPVAALNRAAAQFRALNAANDLPAPMPDAAQVADMEHDYYGPHRFRYGL